MNVVGVDSESYPFTRGNPVPRNVCFSFSDGRVLLRDAGVAAWRELLLDPETTVVCHNVGYEVRQALRVLYEAGEDNGAFLALCLDEARAGRLLDTMTADSILCAAFKGQVRQLSERGLRNLCDLWGVPAREQIAKEGLHSVRLRYNEVDGVPVSQWPEGFVRYALEDAEDTAALWAKMSARPVIRRTDSWNNEHVIDLASVVGEHTAAAITLAVMSSLGILTDEAQVAAYTACAEDEIATVGAQLKALGVLRESGTEDRKVMQGIINYVYDGAPPLTDKGSIRTDKYARLEAPGEHPALELYGQYKRAEKRLSTYAKPVQGRKFVTYSVDDFKVTGRPSAYDPNMLNPPRNGGFRECFIARDGWAFVQADYNCMEVRSWAWACKQLWGLDSEALRRFNEDENYDPHCLTGGSIHGVFYGERLSYEEFRRRLKAGDKQAKYCRGAAKPTNFGELALMKERALCRSAVGYGIKDMTIEQASRCIEAWYAADPAHKAYHTIIERAKSRTRNSIDIGVGRLFRGKCAFQEAANYPFQSLAAQGAKVAAVNVMRACVHGDPRYPALLGCRPLIFMYDELILEAPIGQAFEALRDLRQAMRDGQQQYHEGIPVVTDGAVMLRWSKDHEGPGLHLGQQESWYDRRHGWQEKRVLDISEVRG